MGGRHGERQALSVQRRQCGQYAPPDWHSVGTAIDQSYAVLDTLARSGTALPPEPGAHPRVSEPPRFPYPLEGGYGAPDPAAVAGQDVWLVHPWSLADPPAGCLPVAVLDADWHARWPWSQRRWAFVSTRLYRLAALRWFAPAAELVEALQAARSVRGWHDAHLSAPAWAALKLPPPPVPWPEPAVRCRSFSAYWAQVRRHSASRPTTGELFHD